MNRYYKRLALELLLLFVFLQGCLVEAVPCQGNGVSPLYGNFDGYKCSFSCECNTQDYIGYCGKSGVCIVTGERLSCAREKQTREILLSNRYFSQECGAVSEFQKENCSTKTFAKVCKDKNLQSKRWGNCLCVGKTCPSGTSACGKSCSVNSPCSCVDISQNPSHCGGCGKKCPSGGVCQKGKCSCPKGTILCPGSNACINTKTDSNHCGGCGKKCSSGGACFQGLCQEVYVSAGSYVRGTPDHEVNWKVYNSALIGIPRFRETPHPVVLTRPFFLGRFEVSRKWFRTIAGYDPSGKELCKTDNDMCPASHISFYQAMDFCNKLSVLKGLETCYKCSRSPSNPAEVFCSEKSHFADNLIYQCKGYRLPTDAEWEFAARAGTKGPFYKYSPNSIDVTKDYLSSLGKLAWYNYNSNGVFHPVYVPPPKAGQKPHKEYKEPNSWGLYHMLGNVSEWVWDTTDRFPQTLMIDPCNEIYSIGRHYRGGSIFLPPLLVRCGFRGNEQPDLKNAIVKEVAKSYGFRIARTSPTTNESCSRLGLSSCDAAGCRNTRLDRDHCGRCGHRCKDKEVCLSGRCVANEVKVSTKDKSGKPIVWLQGHMTPRFDAICAHNIPERKVRLTHEYMIQRYEVSQLAFKRLSSGFNPSRFRACESCPVESVTWFMALKYANLLSTLHKLPQCYDCKGDISDPNLHCSLKKEYRGNQGKDYYKCFGYRLPSEAEWEFAALGGAKRKHNCREPEPAIRLTLETWMSHNSKEKTHSVGSLKPNELGIHDMLGNVYEWTWDHFVPYQLPSKSTDVFTDPISPYFAVPYDCARCKGTMNTKDKLCYPCFRTKRGGGYNSFEQPDEASRLGVHSTDLNKFFHGSIKTLVDGKDKGARNDPSIMGFRLVRTLPQK